MQLPNSFHIHAGLAAGMVLSLIWMLLLRFCAGVMAWAVVFVANLLCAACAMLAFMKASHPVASPLHVLCALLSAPSLVIRLQSTADSTSVPCSNCCSKSRWLQQT